MADVAHSIDLDLANKLRDDPKYRQRFFLAEASAHIAAQLIALRKRRGLSQKEVAQLAGTRQPAISRAEQADYQNWSLNTLRSIADALHARIRVYIQPAEDILGEYESANSVRKLDEAERAILKRLVEQSSPRSQSEDDETVIRLEDEPVKLAGPTSQRWNDDASLAQDLKRMGEGGRLEQRKPKWLSDEGADQAWR
jgi:transcriptional regulator with XRE-family HTH domain